MRQWSVGGRLLTAVMVLCVGVSGRFAEARAQGLELADRGPRFLYAASPADTPVPVDVTASSLLRRRVALPAPGRTVEEVLDAIARQVGVHFVYSRQLLAGSRRVQLEARSITVAAALTEILVDAGVDVLLSDGGQVALIQRSGQPADTTGAIAGRVTDARGGPVVGAEVALEGTRFRAQSGADGRYRIPEVPRGTYTLRARYIGYVPAAAVVTVGADQEVTADFALERAIQQLEGLVTTGTVVPTEVKALPTPITVVTAADIEEQRPRTLAQLFRQSVPSAVAWNDSRFPQNTMMSVRGSSSFVPGTNAMKMYIDGVEVANRAVAGIDPAMIERVEVIRGPQAATIYGSDAVGGVVQIFTKRGDSTLTRPRLEASAAVGMLESPYRDGGAVRQSYSGSALGGGRDYSYAVGGSFTRTGDWLPFRSTLSVPSVYAGIRVRQGQFALDLSGRYTEQLGWDGFNPELQKTGYAFMSKPYDYYYPNSQQTVGGRLTHTVTPWWQQTLTFGADRRGNDEYSTKPRLTTPADTLLIASSRDERKVSIGYQSSFSADLGPSLSASLVAGFDHYVARSSSFFASAALRPDGNIETPSGRPITASRGTGTNTGYFGQVQIGYRSTVFLTAGLRAERNSAFGRDFGTPVAPRVGLAYNTALGATSIKLRGSYGAGIRPPQLGFSQASDGLNFRRLANPNLGPERQKGWDAGFDLLFGSQGSLSATYYSQVAKDLIANVLLELGPPQVSQYQNVGRVTNRGLEIDAGLHLGPAQLRGQFALTDSRVDELGPMYTGDLRAGERPFDLPKYTAGASLTVWPAPSTTVTAGLTYVGGWVAMDVYARYACIGGTGPCHSSTRDYYVDYPGFTKVNVAVTQRLTPWASAFLSVDNATNNTSYESTNLAPVAGRLTTVGLRINN